MIFRVKTDVNPILAYFLASLAFILAAILTREFYSATRSPEKIKTEFQKVLHQKESRVISLIEKLRTEFPTDTSLTKVNLSEELKQINEREGLSFFVFQKGSVLFWSTNTIPVPDSLIRRYQTGDKNFVKLLNGWYEILETRDASRIYAGFILIKHEYPLENEFLDDQFQKNFHVPAGSTFSLAQDTSGKFRPELHVQQVKEYPGTLLIILFSLYMTGFIFLVISMYFGYRWIDLRWPLKWLFPLLFAADVIILRMIQFLFRLPNVIYDSALFSPLLFSSSSLLPSLGDLFINSILFLIMAYVFYLHSPKLVFSHPQNPVVRFLKCFALIAGLLAGLWYSLHLAKQLVVNSTIPFTLQNISSLSGYSIFGFVIIAVIFLSYLLVALRLLEYLSQASGFALKFPSKGQHFQRFSMASIIFYLVFFSIAVTGTLNYFNSSVEREKRKLLALKLGTERDPVAELKFSKEESVLLKDPVIEKLNKFIPDTAGSDIEDSITDYMEDRYFRKDWNNYTIQITLCSGQSQLKIQPQNYLINCDSYFSDIIGEFGKPTLSNHLYYLDYGYAYRNYLGIVPLYNHHKEEGQREYTAYIEISSRLVFKDLGYPELLIDKRQNQLPDLSEYSYAFYRNGKLIHRVGKFQYSLDLDHTLAHHNKSAHFYVRDGMSHYCQPIDENTTLVLSKKEDTIIDKIAPFSYLFLLFAFISLVFYIIIHLPSLSTISLSKLGDRLQVSMIGIMGTSFIIIGFLVVYYIIRLNSEKNMDNLSGLTHSILVELQHKMEMMDELPHDSVQDLNAMMTKFSNVFFSDVNLYTPEGKLAATSRPQIFDEGLISGWMNRVAFVNLKTAHSSLYIHNEAIGKHRYYSAYIPFVNDRGKLLAYLNLPYFAKQDDLKREISNFLVAFINIYVFLIILAIFIVLVVTNYISRPLRMLTLRLGGVTLDKMNEKLEWKRKDEIGRLVEEYNRMIDELLKSAELLAQSERESAWREMARQVAHEIKNPLTPMKLSVQYLQKSWDENAPDWSHRLKRFTETMVEQIETLSQIATEFSDFAKIPEPRLEVTDLTAVIRNAVSFYHDISPIKINFNPGISSAPVLADPKQMIRVFTNLINNSVQAIGENQPGTIEISIFAKEKRITVKIEDTGVGIKPDEAGKIFQPNFTTKSGGMGLGLAIVKSIILSSGGEIAFHSEPGTKTVFTISLPAYSTSP
jgi:two-component system, NtrC family, nitrogen regulation sensor histidine kinase NtrY